MLYGIFRYVFGITVFLVLLNMLNKKKLLRKYTIILLFVGCLALISLSYFIPIENLFVTFSSPENAFYYSCGSKIDEIVEGKESCMIIFSDDNRRNCKQRIFPKTNSGYKIGTDFTLKNIVYQVEDEFILRIIKLKRTNEYYLILVGSSQNNVELSDNKDTFFIKNMDNVNNSVYSDVEFYAYIGNIDENYKLYLNNKEVTLNIKE